MFSLEKLVEARLGGGGNGDRSGQLIVGQVEPIDIGELSQRSGYASREAVRVQSPAVCTKV